ncbi:MAG: hypothetical protein MRK02_04550 [Candidatus Scalindua sp.]|nr:hypothetical protein [Candidatus Scalindua sp.]
MSIVPMDLTSFLKESKDHSERVKKIDDLYEAMKQQKDDSFPKFPENCLKEINQKKEEGAFSKEIFHLLNVYEIKFCETGMKEKYPKVYHRIYYCFYIIYKNWENQDEVAEIKTWIQKKWLTVCFNSLTDKNLKCWLESRIIDPGSSIDVEENVKKILFDKDGILKEEFRQDDSAKQENKEMIYYAYRASDWFLKRYDWRSALTIKWRKSRIIFCIPYLLIFLNIFFVLSITLDLIFNSFSNDLQPHMVSIVSDTLAHQKREMLMETAKIGIPYIVEFFISVCMGIVFFAFICAHKVCLEWVKFFLPRLLGAVFVGFIPLVAGSEMYTFPLSLTWFQVSVGVFILVLIAFLYLTLECYTLIGKKGGIFWRASSVILYGLFASFLMALCLCDIAAVHFIDYSKGSFPTGYRGLVGVIYPKIVLFYAPAALLIGIFIQIFWEEKTITEPL